MLVTATAPGWQATCRIRRITPYHQYAMFGMLLRNSSDGKSVTLAIGTNTVSGINSDLYTNDTTYSSGRGLFTSYLQDIWLRIKNDTTNRKFYCSLDGVNWQQIKSEARTTHTTPDQVGVYLNPNSNGNANINGAEVYMIVYSWQFEELA